MTPRPASLPPLFVDVGGIFSHPPIFNGLDITAPLLPAAGATAYPSSSCHAILKISPGNASDKKDRIARLPASLVRTVESSKPKVRSLI